MKKFIKYIIACLLLVLSINTSKAQNTNTLYFMDNIAERNNLNPTFMPNCNFYLDFIFLPNMHFNFGNNNFIFNDFIFRQNGQPSLFLNSQENINKFYNSLNPSTEIKFNFGLNILSFGFKVRRHYFAFDMGINAETYTHIPRDIMKLALYGAQDPNGINTFDFSTLGVNATLYSKIGVGYSYKINKQWQVGIKAKFLMGYANINTDINTMDLNISRQAWSLNTDGTIRASLPINMSAIDNITTNDIIAAFTNPTGIGGAIDLGFTYKPTKNLTITASVTDLGYIYWRYNNISGTIKGSHEITELIDYTVGDELDTEKITNMFTQLGEDIIGSATFNEETETYKTMLRGNFYAGVEYGILKNRISIGAVNRLTFQNQRTDNELTLALNLRPVSWFKATVDYSFMNGHYGTLGLGLNMRVGIFNMFLLADYLPISFAEIQSGNIAIPIPNKMSCFNLQMGWNWNIGNHNKDADFDGVKRKKDRCDNTDIDFLRKKCPNLKKKTDFVDKNGCEYDDDRDGIHNCYDQCPETPEGIEVNKNGCPINLNN